MGFSLVSSILATAIIVQFVIIAYLLRHANIEQQENNAKFAVVAPTDIDKGKDQPTKRTYAGVAVTLFLHSPTWFQKRYTVMVQNALENIPRDWAVQIFYHKRGQSLNAITINKSIQRMAAEGRVILTIIPDEIIAVKKKYFEMWTERWLWEAMVADKVLVFNGNAAICSNSKYTVQNFTDWDFLGSPWDAFQGFGGDGTISIRSRNAMVAAIDYAHSKVPPVERAQAYKKFGQEDRFFVSNLLEMNKRGLGNYKVAPRTVTLQYSAIGSHVNDDVLVASGVLPGITYTDRDRFLAICPELKVLFLSLHDPACFGASPNASLCANSICALQVPKRKGGC